MQREFWENLSSKVSAEYSIAPPFGEHQDEVKAGSLGA